MKDKIMYLILGILIGAIITAGCFLVFTKNSKPNFPKDMDRPNMEDNENFERGRKFRDNENTVSNPPAEETDNTSTT